MDLELPFGYNYPIAYLNKISFLNSGETKLVSAKFIYIQTLGSNQLGTVPHPLTCSYDMQHRTAATRGVEASEAADTDRWWQQ